MDKSCGVNQLHRIDALRIHIRMFQMVQLVRYNHQLILIIVGMEAKLQRKYPQLQLKQMKLRLEQNGYLQRNLRIEVIEYCYNDYVNKPLQNLLR